MAYKTAGDVVKAIREGTYKRTPKTSSSSGGGKEIYVPIEDVVKVGGTADIKEGASVYERDSAQENFVRTGRRTRSGIDSSPQSTLDTPTPSASEFTAQNKAKADYDATKQQIDYLKSQGAREVIKESRDVKTGDKLKIFEYEKGSKKVRVVKNIDTGETKYSEFGIGRGGGSPRLKKQVTVIGEEQPITEEQDSSVINLNFEPSYLGETYLPSMGAFIRPSEPSGQATGFFRFPSFSESIKIKEAEIAGNAIVRVPAQYFGTIFNKQISEELAEKGSKGGFFQRSATFLNPKYQYEVAKFNEELRQAQIDYTMVEASGGIQDIKTLSVLSQPRVDTFKAIGESSLTGKQKTALAGGIRATQTIPYFFPATRAILGTDIALGAAQDYPLAQTKTEKGFTIATGVLGAGLAYSGIKGLTVSSVAGGGGIDIKGTPAQLNLLKGTAYASGTAIAVSVGGIDYYSTLASTGSKEVALGAAIGTSGTLIGGMLYPTVKTKTQDYLRTRNLERIYTPDLEAKPFIRATPSGKKQLVFYERAEAVRWYNPKTYKYKGYKAGQFYRRQYQLIDPLVQAKIQGKTSLTYFGLKEGKVVKLTETTASFPYSEPSTQLGYFTGKNQGIEQFYLPKKFLPKGVIKEAQGFGYSASPTTFIETPELSAYQTYYSGKGISAYFFRMGDESSFSVQIGGKQIGVKPTAYQSYFKNIVENPATREITVPNPLGGNKGWKQYLLSRQTSSGTLNLPLFKQEVEGVVTGTRSPLGSSYYFKFQGRRIPFETGFYNVGDDIAAGIRIGTASESTYIPTSSYVPSPKIVPLFSTTSFSSTKEVSSVPPTVISSKEFNLSSSGQRKYSRYVSSPVSSPISSPVSSRISSPVSSSPISSPVSSPISSPVSSSPISSPVSSPISSPVSSPISSPVSSRISSPVSSPISSPKSSIISSSRGGYSGYFNSRTTSQKSRVFPLINLPKSSSKGFGSYQVSVRRGGKFYNIGTFGTAKQAFEAGRLKTSETLAATFKVTTPSKIPRSAKGYYTRRTKEGTLFIELPKYRLSKRKEKEEIQLYKKKKRKKKR